MIVVMIWKMIRDHWVTYAFELIVSIVIVSISFPAFVVYAFISLVIKIDAFHNLLKAQVGASSLASNSMLMALLKKQKVTDEEVEKQVTYFRDNLRDTRGDKALESFDEDIKIMSSR